MTDSVFIGLLYHRINHYTFGNDIISANPGCSAYATAKRIVEMCLKTQLKTSVICLATIKLSSTPHRVISPQNLNKDLTYD